MMNLANVDFGRLTEQLIAWGAAALPNLLAGIVLLVAGWWFAAWTERTLLAVLARQERVEPTLRTVLASIIRYAILVLVVVAALGQLGIQTTSILAALGAIGLAIGLALQGTLSNIAAGMMLLWLRPFRVGDYIESDGIAGTLTDFGLFACHIHTWDGIFQFVPNAQLWNKRVINYSRLPTRLVDLKFGIAYDDPISKARDVLIATAADNPLVFKEPEPITFVSELGDSAVVIGLRVWTSTPDYWTVRRALTEQGKLALEQAGMTIPFPQRDVHVYPTGSAPDAQVLPARA